MDVRLDREAVGVGLRPCHIEEALSGPPPVDWFEVVAENHIGTGPIPRRNLRKAVDLVPVSLHGVSLDLLGTDPVDLAHVGRVDALARELGSPCFSDHLCWTRLGDWNSHDLLPTPFTEEIAEHAAIRAKLVQEGLSVPFGIENLSSYVAFEDSTMQEWEFYSRVVREAGVWMMLDINNIFVSACNHGFDPVEYLDAMDWDRVLYVHLAGHSVQSNGLRIDTHDGPVCPEVWDLYAKAWTLGGPFPTLIEWDANFPTWDRLVEEARSARAHRRGVVHA